MNGRASVVRLFLLNLGLVIVLAVAQRAPAAMIDSSVKASTDAATVRAAVGPFIQQQIASLQKDDPAAQTAARDALTSEATAGPQRTSSSTYLDIYSDELNKALLPVMDNPSMNIRLNAAIAAARVAADCPDHPPGRHGRGRHERQDGPGRPLGIPHRALHDPGHLH